MGLIACICLSCLLPQQPQPASASRADSAPAPELVLVTPTMLPGIASYGLGDGGLDASRAAVLQLTDGGCTTPGGVQVRVRREGVLVEFPDKQQLLFAPDGHLHLRDGSAAGPFAGGVALHFADGAALRIDRSGSRRSPIGQVTVIAGTRCERLWYRDRAVAEPVRASPWNGVELLCGGDGTAIYRGIGLGPLLVLERALAPQRCQLPDIRLALFTTPLLQSLDELARQYRHVEPEAQLAVRQLGVLAQQASQIFAGRTPPMRNDARRIRYGLAGGYDLAIELGEGGAVQLGLCCGDDREPLVEWTLGYSSELRMIHPRLHEAASTARYYRGNVWLQPFLPEFAARSELLELPAARTVLQKLQR